jgi:2-polyprenyl-3-methyl-5-hydroxy-6-metoxy-1,4-benzoquinol methylase
MMTAQTMSLENSTIQRLARARVEDFNDTQAEAFAEKLLGTLNTASVALMISIGHRTRLFDVMAKIDPATSADIARAARLNERYVREWLGTMVTGGIVEYYPSMQTYYLPPEHAASLTRAASPGNLANTFQFIPLLAAVEDQIVECFKKGGGVPYSAYPRFQEVMAEESNATVVAGLLNNILPLVPELVEQLEQGIEVLDVGCGQGRALILLAETFPQSQFTGYDFSPDGIASACAEAAAKGLTNIRFVLQDAAGMTETKRYHLVTAFDAIHDQAKPRQVLRGIAQALHDDGLFLMQDIRASSHVHNNIGQPLGPFTYTVSCLHCMTVSLALGGEGLGAAWGEEKAIELLNEAGFANITVKQLPHDIINNYYLARH